MLENFFFVGLDDCFVVICYVLENIEIFGMDLENIILMGVWIKLIKINLIN